MNDRRRMSIRDRVKTLFNPVLGDDDPITNTVTTEVLDILQNYRQQIVDLIRLQPDRMVTKSNVIGLIEGMKLEWGR